MKTLLSFFILVLNLRVISASAASCSSFLSGGNPQFFEFSILNTIFDTGVGKYILISEKHKRDIQIDFLNQAVAQQFENLQVVRTGGEGRGKITDESGRMQVLMAVRNHYLGTPEPGLNIFYDFFGPQQALKLNEITVKSHFDGNKLTIIAIMQKSEINKNASAEVITLF